MYVRFGNVAPIEPYYDNVDPDAYSADALRQKAQDAKVDDSGTKEDIAARLASQPQARSLGDEPRATEVTFPKGVTIAEAFTTLANNRGIITFHTQSCPECSDEPVSTTRGAGVLRTDEGDQPCGSCAGTGLVAPAWVESDSPGLQALLAEHFGCEEGAPADIEETHWTMNGPPGVDITAEQGEDA